MKFNTTLATIATLFATSTLSTQAYDISAYNMGNASKTDHMVGYTQPTTFLPYYWNYTTSDDSATRQIVSSRQMVPVIANGQTITNTEVGPNFNGQYIYTSWRYYQERTGQVSYPTNAIWVNTQNGYGFYIPTTSYGNNTQTIVIYIVSNQTQSSDLNGRSVITLGNIGTNVVTTNTSNTSDYRWNEWNRHREKSYDCKNITTKDTWVETRTNVWTRVAGKTTTECGYNSSYDSRWTTPSYTSYVDSYTPSTNNNHSTYTWSLPSTTYTTTPSYNIERPSAPTLRINYKAGERAGKLVWTNPGAVMADEWRLFENGIQIAASRITSTNQNGEYALNEARIGSEYRIELCRNDFCSSSSSLVSAGRY